MSLPVLLITKLKTLMFLSYECHSLIQDLYVFHIFTLTSPSNDTWECLFCSVCAFQLLTYYNLLLNLKGSFFEPAVGSLPNFACMCGYRRY